MISPESNREFEHRQGPVIRALVDHVNSCVPRDWGIAALELDVQKMQPGGRMTLRHRLYNPGSRRDLVEFPQALFETTSRYHALCCEFGHSWVRATVVLVFNLHHELMRHEMHYEYARPAGGVNTGSDL